LLTGLAAQGFFWTAVGWCWWSILLSPYCSGLWMLETALVPGPGCFLANRGADCQHNGFPLGITVPSQAARAHTHGLVSRVRNSNLTRFFCRWLAGIESHSVPAALALWARVSGMIESLRRDGLSGNGPIPRAMAAGVSRANRCRTMAGMVSRSSGLFVLARLDQQSRRLLHA